MEHIAILRKAKISKGDDLLKDILSGKKTIESRWYVNRVAPWNKIKSGEKIYLKQSGQPVCAVVEVDKVLQIEFTSSTNPLNEISEIVKEYGGLISPNTTREKWQKWIEKQTSKRYCILIFLKNPQVIPPFKINKKGFGNAAAWLCTEDVYKLKIA
jgi:ASC-1-like (ASCH) protein